VSDILTSYTSCEMGWLSMCLLFMVHIFEQDLLNEDYKLSNEMVVT